MLRKVPLLGIISIHALLAESDSTARPAHRTAQGISIHALLAESDLSMLYDTTVLMISIHALLAESDARNTHRA